MNNFLTKLTGNDTKITSVSEMLLNIFKREVVYAKG